MDSADQLLHFSFRNMKYFVDSSKDIISRQSKSTLKDSLEVLSSIGEGNYDQIGIDDSSITLIFSKIVESIKTGKPLSQYFSKKSQIKKITFLIDHGKNPENSILNYDEMLFSVMELITSNWSNTYFYGLFITLLRNWEHHNATIIRESFVEKLIEYNGNRRDINQLKTNVKYFATKDGPVLIASKMLSNNMPLNAMNELLDIPVSLYYSQYFHNVIRYYTSTLKRHEDFEKICPQLIDFICQFGNLTVKKKNLSELVLKTENNISTNLIEEIRKAAYQHIGDPANPAKWTPWKGADEYEKNILSRARIILNVLINNEFISLFFDKIAMDVDRKNFWLSYTNVITNFKIYGTESTKRQLIRDERLKPYLEARFGGINSSDIKNTAILFKMWNYTMVEFGQKGGAFYAYLNSNPIVPDIQNNYQRVYDLKNAKVMPYLMYSGSLTSQVEGRYHHTLGWEPNLHYWIKNYVLQP